MLNSGYVEPFLVSPETEFEIAGDYCIRKIKEIWGHGGRACLWIEIYVFNGKCFPKASTYLKGY